MALKSEKIFELVLLNIKETNILTIKRLNIIEDMINASSIAVFPSDKQNITKEKSTSIKIKVVLFKLFKSEFLS